MRQRRDAHRSAHMSSASADAGHRGAVQPDSLQAGCSHLTFESHAFRAILRLSLTRYHQSETAYTEDIVGRSSPADLSTRRLSAGQLGAASRRSGIVVNYCSSGSTSAAAALSSPTPPAGNPAVGHICCSRCCGIARLILDFTGAAGCSDGDVEGRGRRHRLLTLMIWLIQPINDDTLTYTPGTSCRPQPKPCRSRGSVLDCRRGHIFHILQC